MTLALYNVPIQLADYFFYIYLYIHLFILYSVALPLAEDVL